MLDTDDTDDTAAKRSRAIEDLDGVAADLRVLGSRALLRGDFDEIARVVAASYAVHQAVIACRTTASAAAPAER